MPPAEPAGPDGPLLEVRGLSVVHDTPDGPVTAVDAVDLSVGRGQLLAVVGGSGSGKSTVLLAVARLLGPAARTAGGEVRFRGTDLVGLDDRGLAPLRWRHLAIVLQSAMGALNPVTRIERQFWDAMAAHGVRDRRRIRRRSEEVLALVGVDTAHLRSHPHELSGGMRQRAVIAMALLLAPDLLLLDEPTSALDAVTQRALMERIAQLQRSRGLAVVIATHDLAVVARYADAVLVLDAGRVVEAGPVRRVLDDPTHPRTKALVQAASSIGGPRRPRSAAGPAASEEVLAARGLGRTFRAGGPGRRTVLRAVDDVDLAIGRGEIVALVGGSGSGKTTLARMLAQLLPPTSGEVRFRGTPLRRLHGRAERLAFRGAVPVVLQDPFDALHPARPVSHGVLRALALHRPDLDADARRREAERVAEAVGLLPAGAMLRRRPHELSGGELQRIAFAQALACRPSVIVADEPLSMLDASLRTGLLDVMATLRDEHGVSVLHITHDIASARSVADRVVVMHEGRIVEAGPAEEVLRQPRHPATRRLVDAASGA